MSNSKLEQAKRKYAEDLRTLRKQKGVSLDAICTETKVIKTVLEEFEINCLHRNNRFNKVYLYSLVGSYAKIVGLDGDQILSALDMALDGSYDGRLSPDYKPKEKPAKLAESSTKKSANTSEPNKGASPPKADKRTRGG